MIKMNFVKWKSPHNRERERERGEILVYYPKSIAHIM